LPHVGKTSGLYTLVRKAETDDLEAQVKALQELQKQPSFLAGKQVPRRADSGLMAGFKKRWDNIIHLLFRNRQRPIRASQTKGDNLNLRRGKNKRA